MKKISKIILSALSVLSVLLLLVIGFALKPAGSDLTPGVDYVPEEVIALADSPEQAQQIAEAYGVELKSYAYGVAVFITPNPEAAIKLSKKTQKDGLPLLGYNWRYKTYQVNTPSTDIYQINTPRMNKARSQATQGNTGLDWYHKEIYTERAWEYSTGAGATVAIIDSGIAVDHPAFTGRISELSYNSHTDQVGKEYVEDDFGHGTHVSGIVAAYDAEKNVFGVAPDAEILTIKANNPEDIDHFETAALIRGINYAVENGADIINMSLGREWWCGPDEIEETAITNAVKEGVTIVAAAGNESFDHAGYPAAYEEIIAVSATGVGYKFALQYSNYGPEIDIAAPGSNIYSTSAVGTPLDNYYGDGSGYVAISGTSMASPNVAGVAALIVAQNPGYTPEEVREVLLGSAQDAGVLGWDDRFGHGVVSAYAAMLDSSELLDATYNLMGEQDPVIVKVAPGATLIRPQIYSDGTNYNTWYKDDALTMLFDFSWAIEENVELYEGLATLTNGTWLKEFPDEIFRGVVMSEIGAANELSAISPADLEELRSHEEMFLDFMGIKDLTGIKYLSNLQLLSCSYNELTSLDLRNNPALLEVVCNDNELASVNIAGNRVLEYLILPNNDLSTLDVSTNVALEMLDVRLNNIPSTDDVIGWREIGLVLGETFLYDSNPILIFSQPFAEYSNEGIDPMKSGHIIPSLGIGAATKKGMDLQFQWFINTTETNSGGTPIPGGTTPYLSFEHWHNKVGVNYYYCVVSAEKEGAVVASIASEVAKVTYYNQASIYPRDADFVTSVGGDILIYLYHSDYELNQIAIDTLPSRVLEEDVDYTVNEWYESEYGDNYKFTESFFQSLPLGAYHITFDMIGGAGSGFDPILTLTVSDEKIAITGEIFMSSNVEITMPGKDLSPDPFGIMPPGAASGFLSWQWSRSETVDGEFIPIDTMGSSGYTVQDDDIGYYLQLTAIGTGAYTGEISSNKILVQASAPALVNIVVTAPPTKTKYLYGDALDLTGLVVTANYSDSSNRVITRYTTNPAAGSVREVEGGFDPATITNVNIQYQEDNIFKYAGFDIRYKISVPNELTSDIFTFDQDNNFVRNIPERTTVRTILAGLKEKPSQYYNFIELKKSEKSLKQLDVVGTGTKLLITDWAAYDGNTLVRTYNLVVKGDTDGDGEITAGDAYDIILHSIDMKILAGAYLEAAKINSSDEVTAGDAYDVILYSIGIKAIL